MTAMIVNTLKQEDQDFEWYPTTSEMLAVVRRHIKGVNGRPYRDESEQPSVSILDCGAGDGRALKTLSGDHSKLFAIEKSSVLIGLQPKEIVPVGTDFHYCTLIDKKADVVFSNPPYSEFEFWATKIIREANSPSVYLVIPERWERSLIIAEAIEARQAETEILHRGDFLEADRAARSKVHVIYVNLAANKRREYYRQNEKPTVDPFKIWFEQTFPQPEPSTSEQSEAKLKAEVQREMVSGRNLIESLVSLYNRDMGRLQQNYAAACSLDADLLKELSVSYVGLSTAIQEKIKGLKHIYWQEFFRNYESITERLTSASRRRLLDTLHGNMSVDFTADNAYAITLWVIRNANHYYDSQLIDLVERMVRKANVAMYKSNQRTFRDEEWRYGYREDRPKLLDRYKLEYRIVLDCMGGIVSSDSYWRSSQYNGLEERSVDFLNDVVAVAQTLGWNTHDSATRHHGFNRTWESNQSQAFSCENGDTLMEVRAFKNGNLHIKFNQKFMRKLNVEFGRLMGWVKDHSQAAKEMGIPEEEARQYFRSNLQISHAQSALLLERMEVAA